MRLFVLHDVNIRKQVLVSMASFMKKQGQNYWEEENCKGE